MLVLTLDDVIYYRPMCDECYRKGEMKYIIEKPFRGFKFFSYLHITLDIAIDDIVLLVVTVWFSSYMI